MPVIIDMQVCPLCLKDVDILSGSMRDHLENDCDGLDRLANKVAEKLKEGSDEKRDS